jgi:hypothetical protein
MANNRAISASRYDKETPKLGHTRANILDGAIYMATLTHELKATYAFMERNANLVKRY